MSARRVAALQFETRWQGRLVGLHRHAPGSVVEVGGTRFDVVGGGVVVDGVRRAVDVEPLALRCGPLRVVVSDPAQAAVAKGDSTIDLGWWRTLSTAVLVMAGVLGAIAITPVLPRSDVDDLHRGQVTLAHVTVVPKPEKPQKTTAPKPASTSPATKQNVKPEGASTRTAQKRERDRASAMDALAALGLTGPMATASVFGAATDIDSALNQLSGAGMANGGPGLGVRGVGEGGVGVGIALGSIGSGRPPGSGPGVRLSDHNGTHTKATVRTEKVIYESAMDRSEIQRVMDRAMSRIRYCYERALTGDADLDGKLTSLFMIGPTGDVVSVSKVQSTLNDEVDGCVHRVLKSLKFPAPKGGGTVSVTYPFVFSAH